MPLRLQGMDTYSNVLYVKDEFAALSAMAHRAVVTEKYCPESACIVGNYYSMKGDHDKVHNSHFRCFKLLCRPACRSFVCLRKSRASMASFHQGETQRQ